MAMLRGCGAAIALSLVAASGAFGAGYGIYEQGAAVMGRAGAGTASVRDASGIFYNPAALTRLEHTELQVGGSLLQTFTEFEGADPYPGPGVEEEMEEGVFFLPTLYVTHPYANGLVLGFGVNSPFGLRVQWKDPESFSGRGIVTDVSLETLQGNLVAAWPLNEGLSVAGGVSVIAADVRLENYRLATFPTGPVNVAKVALNSDWGTAIGWNAALHAHRDGEPWSLGLTWRSEMDVDLEGDADFTQIPTGNPLLDAAVALSLPADQGVRTTVHLPPIGGFGMAWDRETWGAEATVVFTGWKVFDELPLDFDGDSVDTRIVEDYDDTWAFRIGAERRFPGWTARAGYYYETVAAPLESFGPILPDAARHGITLGAGFAFGATRNLVFDVYDLALFPETRDSEGKYRDNFQGEYDSYVNALGFSLSWRW